MISPYAVSSMVMAPGIGAANATFCATLVDEWLRCGVRQAVVSPGSRCTPLVLALASRREMTVHVVHDERVAGFVALGIGLGGTPAVLACTSGTAAANLLPAVVEAGLSEVPMIVATADRPPELRGVGAPQTIDQVELYGRSVRWFHDAVVPDMSDRSLWRALAQRVVATAAGGPVHLNLPFREPLLGDADEIPEPIGEPIAVPRTAASVGVLDSSFDLQRGVIVAGGRSGVDPASVVALANRLGWPVLADPLSRSRGADAAVTAFDSMLRNDDFATAHAPELVVRIGRPPSSKVLSQWVARSGARVVQVGGPGVIDPDHNVSAVCGLDDLTSLTGAASTPWMARWRRANDRAESAIGSFLDEQTDLSEPAVARTIAEALPDGVGCVVASSMPVRDYEWFGGRAAHAHANRGANGIDGVMSTALGRALDGEPTVAIVGDIAFAHDSNALVALTDRVADLRVVVVDNGGGGIFSFLPQASELDHALFERLFGTPHHTDVELLAAAHHVPARTVDTAESLAAAISVPGPSVTRVVTDRAENVAVHDRLNAVVAAAL